MNLPVASKLSFEPNGIFVAEDWSPDFCASDRPEDWGDFDYSTLVDYEGVWESLSGMPYAAIAYLTDSEQGCSWSLYFYRDKDGVQSIEAFVLPTGSNAGDPESEAVWLERVAE
ncbi:hypothetical protein PTQ19_02305 [Microbacterium esteraromaticum]|uniref:hypothetical protein n=1 Tax=Microbacterium esteraromaticum TaxID=57043 RepID=UPI0023676369|nr:hypothetical protein [Microbacterium esteraromaticum]WDH79299.1 hypothetical protein PTQ19_02305 [Microbacterium esteraromaticum]